VVNPQPKSKIFRSEKYKRFIRSLPCCVCGRPESEAAHQKLGEGGMGIKPPDTQCLPLCHECHTKEHQMGELSFWFKVFRVDRKKEIIKCLTLYLEKIKSR
jgi:hypothetical protein